MSRRIRKKSKLAGTIDYWTRQTGRMIWFLLHLSVLIILATLLFVGVRWIFRTL